MSRKTRISYTKLQKKYPGKIIALSEEEDKVLAAGKDVVEVERELLEKGYLPEKAIFWGPKISARLVLAVRKDQP
ncbi:MAG: hypothetical protein FJ044_05780 [Candidatus Cloacimonetes bacterium]|nr:hypothetical protein [Candidatus Cloacimonadota bacterium]